MLSLVVWVGQHLYLGWAEEELLLLIPEMNEMTVLITRV